MDPGNAKSASVAGAGGADIALRGVGAAASDISFEKGPFLGIVPTRHRIYCWVRAAASRKERFLLRRASLSTPTQVTFFKRPSRIARISQHPQRLRSSTMDTSMVTARPSKGPAPTRHRCSTGTLWNLPWFLTRTLRNPTCTQSSEKPCRTRRGCGTETSAHHNLLEPNLDAAPEPSRTFSKLPELRGY